MVRRDLRLQSCYSNIPVYSQWGGWNLWHSSQESQLAFSVKSVAQPQGRRRLDVWSCPSSWPWSMHSASLFIHGKVTAVGGMLPAALAAGDDGAAWQRGWASRKCLLDVYDNFVIYGPLFFFLSFGIYKSANLNIYISLEGLSGDTCLPHFIDEKKNGALDWWHGIHSWCGRIGPGYSWSC